MKAFLGLEKFWKSHIILFYESLDNRVTFNQILNLRGGLCVYRIVLLIPAAFRFIMRKYLQTFIQYSM